MKKLVILIAFFCLAGNALSSVQAGSDHTKTIQAGPYSMERLAGLHEYPEQLLSALIYPGHTRTVEVYMGINDMLLRMSNLNFYQKNTPYFRQVEQLVQIWLPATWNSWRQAANVYLKPKYRLPELTWKFNSGFDAAMNHQTEQVRSSALIRVETEFLDYGNELASAYAVFTEEGEGLAHMTVYLYPQWAQILSTLQSGKELSANQITDYKKLILYHAAFSEQQQKDYLAQLNASDPKTWHLKGPWADHLQSTISHEFGHMLGLPHADAPSLMTPYASTGALKPTPEDGLRLATLVCWYHNKKANKTVCVPKTPKDKVVQELRATLIK